MPITEPSHVNHPRHDDWTARVAALEEEGLTTSDAQGIADLEFRKDATDSWKFSRAHGVSYAGDDMPH
jgi:hypothetical protein